MVENTSREFWMQYEVYRTDLLLVNQDEVGKQWRSTCVFPLC
jgi:hypothetical protein